MCKIVNLGRVGLFVVMRNGALTTLGGRSYWSSPDEARMAAELEKTSISDGVIQTIP